MDIEDLLTRRQPLTQERIEADIIEALTDSGTDGLTSTAISHVLFKRNMSAGVIATALRSLWDMHRIVGRLERRSNLGRSSVVWRLAEFDSDREDGQITPGAALLIEPVRSETPRQFDSDQKRNIWFNAGGRCCICRTVLGPDWHADHRVPWAAGGETTVENAWALCPKCNLRKSSMRLEDEGER